MPYIEIDHTARPIGPGVLTIGAGTEAGWRIQDHGLSPVHAIIVPEEHGKVSVVQGAADARILVNGEELQDGHRALAVGDRLQLNDIVATYRDVPSELAASQDAYLRDARRGRLYRVTDQSQIGRDLRCTVLIQEPDVSRTHAEIVRQGSSFVIKPAAGVTLLNGERLVEPTALHEGDELMVGRTHLRFSREVPRNAIVGGSSQVNSRAARMRTTFMGTVAMREQQLKTARRKIGRAVAVFAAIGLLVAGLLAVWGAAPQSAQATTSRHPRRLAPAAARAVTAPARDAGDPSDVTNDASRFGPAPQPTLDGAGFPAPSSATPAPVPNEAAGTRAP